MGSIDNIRYRVSFQNMKDEYDFGSERAIELFEKKYQTRRVDVTILPFDEQEDAD